MTLYQYELLQRALNIMLSVKHNDIAADDEELVQLTDSLRRVLKEERGNVSSDCGQVIESCDLSYCRCAEVAK